MDLQSPEGGYYSARDADSEGVEGKFYVWSRHEVQQILEEADATLFCDYYDVTDDGNWEHNNILNVQRTAEVVAKLHKMPVDEFEKRIDAAKKKLFAVRERRIQPHLDDKILASWNGLMIASMAKGYRILGEARFRDSATRAADFVLNSMTKEGRLQRSHRRGTSHTLGYLDDHAFMIEALLNLYETTFDLKWLEQADRLNAEVMKHYRDETDGGFFFSADDSEKILVRIKDANDTAIPSGNSVELMNLQRLAILLDRKDLREEAERMLRFFGQRLHSAPYSSERMLSAVDFYHRHPKELAFVGNADDSARLDELINTAWRTYVPNVAFARLLVDAPEAKKAEKLIPLLAGKTASGGKPSVYVCKDFVCKAPITDVGQLVAEIGPVKTD